MSITGGRGTRAIARRYPVTEGLTAETTKQYTTPPSLIAQGLNGLKSIVKKSDKEGI